MPTPSETVTLHSISGRSVTLPFPTTFKAVFDAAVAPPFSFTPESVKILSLGTLVRVAAHLRQHAADTGGGGIIDASAFSTAGTRKETTGGVIALSTESSPRTPAHAHQPARSLIVYGVPRRVHGDRVGVQATAPAAASNPSSSTSAAARVAAPDTAVDNAHLAGPLTASASAGGAGGATARTTVSLPATQPLCEETEGEAVACAVHSSPPPSKREGFRGPLPYPHSPDGLLELAKAVSAPNADADDDDDLISLLQGAPQRVYNHPTMSYMSNKVKGNLTILRAVVEQIQRVAPVFYAWIEENPQKFLSALNRVGERSLQQVREQLRLLALQAVAGQMNGDGPSRRVMVLEVNTRDGAPDVYQVEVQVGDFSDDDDDDDDDGGEANSSASESMYYASMEHSDDIDLDYDEDEDDDEEEDEEGEEVSTNADSDNNRYGEDDTDVNTADELSYAAVLAEGAAEGEDDPRHSQRSTWEAEASPADHRSQPGPASCDDTSREVAECGGGDCGHAASVVPTSPPGSAPARAWRSSPSPAPRGAAPAASTLADGSSDPTQASSATAATAEATPSDPPEDARLVRLREECHAVDVLRHQYTRQADSLAAQHTHRAIMALRLKFLDTVAEVCVSISAATGEAAGQQSAQLQLLRRVVRCAGDFFGSAEEFYAQLEEEGVRSSVFGPSPQESLAAWAAVAALSRLLLCDVEAAAQDAVAAAASAATHSTTTATSASGPRRVGALRALHANNTLWSNPALHWAITQSPEDLLVSILQLCRQQRAVMVWYSSHYLVKAVGKTIQTMAYVFGGTEEAQQAVALQRLKITSKAHKSDEVADCVRELADVTAAGAVRDSARRQWVALMRTRYQQLVRPLEGDLPTPHMTSNSLYVCDTRHVLPTREPQEERARRAMDSAARWWAAYCDERNTLCADKWCLAATLRPWNAAMASATAQGTSAAERTALRLVKVGDARTNVEASRDFYGLLPEEQVAVGVAASAGSAASVSSPSSSSATAARHSAVLCETVSAPSSSSSSALPAAATAGDEAATRHGLAPRFVGDIHVVDVAPDTAGVGERCAVTSMAGGAALVPHLTTLVRNFALPAAPHRGDFLRRFFEMLACHPKIPAAAAARHAALASATANDAPWLVCEYVLLDYGGAIECLSTPAPTAPADTVTAAAEEEGGEVGEAGFVRMPSVPLGRRLCEPRPVSAVSRGRSSSLSDGETRTTARGAAAAAEEDALKRQYARTHAIDELYEMMLGSLLEHQPTGEENVLDHLVNFLETSGDVMQEKVQRRQSEVVEVPAVAVVPVDGASGAASTRAFASPHPPSTKRVTKGRPSLSRKKSSS